MSSANRLTRATTRRPPRRPLDLRRLREFGAGLLVGVVLASGVFIYMKDADRRAAPRQPRPEPQRAPPATAEAGGIRRVKRR